MHRPDLDSEKKWFGSGAVFVIVVYAVRLCEVMLGARKIRNWSAEKKVGRIIGVWWMKECEVGDKGRQKARLNRYSKPNP